MREINISGLDLNLLPPLAALLRRRNVTHAAADVGLSQPAMSRALARLRADLQDDLLVRRGRGLHLTARAEALKPLVDIALEDIKAVFRTPRFDPTQGSRLLRFAASDNQTMLLFPPLMARLAKEAPGVSVQVEASGPDLVQRMERGVVDFAFGLETTPLPPGALTEPLAMDRLALVMRRGHPAAEREWTLQDYADFDHVGISITGDGVSELDARLAAAGVTRRLALITPHFSAALATVAATDMVTTLSRALASRMAEHFDLILREPPFPQTAIPMTVIFSPLRARDPLLLWMRTLLREVAVSVYEAGEGDPNRVMKTS
jgi:DNA-binding transcriptional LysR family regulator